MSRECRDVWKKLQTGLDCGNRFRIVKHMLLNPEEAFTKYSLTKATGLKTRIVEDHLEVLVKLGWVKKYPYTPTTYQINLEDELVKHLYNLFSKVKVIPKEPSSKETW